MEKTCPRCNAAFECRHTNLIDCHCVTITLDTLQLEYVGNNYTDCLCHSCLQDIKDSFYTNGINPKFNKKQIILCQ